MTLLHLKLDRASPQSVGEQITAGLRRAILEGRLAPGSRLPSWRDLASQLGVARGTVQAAYDRLVDARLAVPAGAAGTRVARRAALDLPLADTPIPPLLDPIADYPRTEGVFQMGVPAPDAFPHKAWARICARAARDAAFARPVYPDARGEARLRTAMAAYLAVARGIACSPAQVFIVGGHAAGVALAVQALGLRGQAWSEDPGYPPTRGLLQALSIDCVPVPVDEAGLDVAAGRAIAPRAALAVVTPGHQAPLGVPLSPARRRALLDWAAEAGAWVFEDDYLGELQLGGRAAPSLAALDPRRVVHLGTFSKTISPALRIGFVVVPASEVPRFSRTAQGLGAAPAPAGQHALAEFLEGGHLLRHLRRMKRLYAERRALLLDCLRSADVVHRASGLAVLMRLPEGVSDVAVAREARRHGLAPVPLSPWFQRAAGARQGLLLGVTTLQAQTAADDLRSLQRLIAGR